MWVAQRCAPVSSPNGQDAQLGDYDGGADGGGYFFGGLYSQTDVSFGITDDDDGLEAGTLTGAGLFLHGLDLVFQEVVLAICSSCSLDSKTRTDMGGGKAHLHDLVLQLGQEEIHNLVLLDGQRV